MHSQRSATGENRWEFFALLTPEQMEVLLAHSDQYAQDRGAPADFRTFWQRIDEVLRSAPSQPFP